MVLEEIFMKKRMSLKPAHLRGRPKSEGTVADVLLKRNPTPKSGQLPEMGRRTSGVDPDTRQDLRGDWVLD
jgi:hypothetical protein